ncbi:MAG TPA: nicotinamide riboside transporter PnuC [Saprospiraceae bacterium]|nr:nicotinamide riboside transporter PnuC [Saprospiraceae bacterium]
MENRNVCVINSNPKKSVKTDGFYLCLKKMIESIQTAWQNLHWSETWAVIFGVLYVVLAARESVWCWFWGILSCSLWAWAAYKIYDLYIDALLQLFYVGVSFAGIWQWLRGGESKKELRISSLKIREHFLWIGLGLGLTFPTGYFFDNYTQAAATYPDAFTTIFSVIATFMVVQKKLENWLYWLAINATYVWLYSSRGSWLFTALFILYFFIAIFGYREWKKIMRMEANKNLDRPFP